MIYIRMLKQERIKLHQFQNMKNYKTNKDHESKVN